MIDFESEDESVYEITVSKDWTDEPTKVTIDKDGGTVLEIQFTLTKDATIPIDALTKALEMTANSVIQELMGASECAIADEEFN